jgi:acyl carrier protein
MAAQFSYEDTFSKVADIIADKLGIEKQRVVKEATLADLGADSLDLVEIIMKMEEQFGIEINDEDAEKMNNVADVVHYIQHKRTK